MNGRYNSNRSQVFEEGFSRKGDMYVTKRTFRGMARICGRISLSPLGIKYKKMTVASEKSISRALPHRTVQDEDRWFSSIKFCASFTLSSLISIPIALAPLVLLHCTRNRPSPQPMSYTRSSEVISRQAIASSMTSDGVDHSLLRGASIFC